MKAFVAYKSFTRGPVIGRNVFQVMQPSCRWAHLMQISTYIWTGRYFFSIIFSWIAEVKPVLIVLFPSSIQCGWIGGIRKESIDQISPS